MDKESLSNPEGENLWRRLILITFLLIALATIFSVARDSDLFNAFSKTERNAIHWGVSLIWFFTGVWLIHHIRKTVAHLLAKGTQSDARVAVVISRIFSGLGYLFVLLVTLHLLAIKIGSILVGSAVTGVIVGVGAQSTLSNLIAGLVIITLRPFSIGNFITIRTYLFGGAEYSGTVIDVNWFHTVLLDGLHRRILPNSSIIMSAITVGETPETKRFQIPLPYSTAFHDFEEQLRGVTDGQASASVKEFFENTYAVEVLVPAGLDLDVIREAIVNLRTQGIAL